MTTVVDASAAMAWCVPDEFDGTAEALLRHVASGHGIVPALWAYEMQNALRNAHRRGRMTEPAIEEVLRRLARLPLRVVDAADSPAFHGAFRLAVEHDLSIYDAVYLEAARRHRAALASRDARLLAIASSLNVPHYTSQMAHG